MSETTGCELSATVAEEAPSRPVALTRWRRLSQAAMLALLGQWSFYGIFRCPFIVPYVSCQNCPVVTCHGRLFSFFWGFWLLLPVSVLLFGRAYCGWLCPGGLVNQLFSKTAPFSLRVKNRLTTFAPYGKYLALAAALYVWLGMGQPRSNIPIRVGEFFGAVALTFEHADLIWLARTFVVLGLTALGLLFANAWCRYFCPAGGLLEALKGIALFKVYKAHSCNDCGNCRKICPMGTRPGEVDCTNCGDCLPVCSMDAVGIGRGKA